jgi:phage FluMu protein Com
MEQIRCPNCNKLLFKQDLKGLAEIICPRCKTKLLLIFPKGDRIIVEERIPKGKK